MLHKETNFFSSMNQILDQNVLTLQYITYVNFGH